MKKGKRISLMKGVSTRAQVQKEKKQFVCEESHKVGCHFHRKDMVRD